jgi:hypothetical protein
MSQAGIVKPPVIPPGGPVLSVTGTPNQVTAAPNVGNVVVGLTDGISLGAFSGTVPPAGGILASGTVSVGTNLPDPSAILEAFSTSQGFLPPVMTTAQKLAIPLPASGLVVYDSDLNQLQFFNGTSWIGSFGLFPITPFVVGPIGQAGYQTIQSAMDAANAVGGGTVYVQQGSYTENLTFFPSVFLIGVSLNSYVLPVVTGTHTPASSGVMAINSISFVSAGDLFFSAAANNVAILMSNCAINCNGYTFDMPNYTGLILQLLCIENSTTNGVLNNTAGMTYTADNSAVGAGSATMNINGALQLLSCPFGCNLASSGGGVTCSSSQFSGLVTLTGSNPGAFKYCEFDQTFTMNSSQNVKLEFCTFDISTPPAIAGSGTGALTLSSINFVNIAAIANTLNIIGTGGFYPSGNLSNTGFAYISNGPFIPPSFQPVGAASFSISVVQFNASGTYTPPVNLVSCVVEMVGGGGGGGGAAANGTGAVSAGGGGGGGEYSRGLFTASQIGASQSIIVGPGGFGGAAGANGGVGGRSSMGLLMAANGGLGGLGAVSSVTGTSVSSGGGGGFGGITGPNIFVSCGGGGMAGFAVLTGNGGFGGSGGSSLLGGGAPSPRNSSNGVSPAEGFGGGGSGAIQTTSTAGQPGGDGARGFVIITQYLG